MPYRILFCLCISYIAVIVPNIAYAGPADVGGSIINLSNALSRVPNILTTIAFISGLFLAVSGVLHLKNHVDNPAQTPISSGIKRLLAGGFFLALPMTTNVVQGSLFGTAGTGAEIAAGNWGVSGGGGGVGLADVAINFIASFAEPMKDLLILFSFISGLAFILIGISRLIKTAQEGPRGPTGIGTLVTFLVGSALMNLGMSMGAFTSSIFGDNTMRNFVSLDPTATQNLSAAEKVDLQNVIGSIMMFVSIVGFIAFVRGLFILKAVADGNSGSQSISLTQAFTFLIGGALAVNITDVVNMIQDTVAPTSAILGFSFQ